MTDILPINTNLGTLMEGSSINVTFTPQLLEGETLDSINIISYEPTPGIIVFENTLSGTYDSVFGFPNGSLLYRENDDFKSANSWEDLPESNADLYLWRAPQNLQKVFSYVVEMNYTYQPPDETGGGEGGSTTTPEPIKRVITKTYTNTIVGNWSRWAAKLRAYVYKDE